MKRAVQLARRFGVDVVVVLLALAAQIEVGTNDLDGPRWALVLLALTSTLPLLYRRRLPLVAPLVVFASLAAWALTAGASFESTVTPFFVAALTAWVTASGNTRERALVGFAALVVTLAIVSSVFSDGWLGNFAFTMLVFGGAWLAGFTLTYRTEQARDLTERAERAERERERRAAEAVAEERARIARELHDVVAHSVSVMVVQAAGVRRLLEPEQEREREALQVVERIGREALTEMRRMLGVLRTSGDSADLAPQPGLHHLERLLEQVRTAGLAVDVEIVGDPVTLPPGLDLSAYRIVQEGLTNALKHGNRGSAHVRVRYGDGELELEVIDESDFQPAAADGLGLAGMRERVAVYGGDFEAGPSPRGFRVRARLPVAGVRA